MKNLKITFEFENYPLLNRYLTIDNILLNAYYKKQKNKKFIKVENDLDNLSKWLKVKNNTLSGSIWYVDDKEIILPHNDILIKKIDDKKYIKETNKKSIDKGRGEFKAYRLGFERLTISSIYFYVSGNKNYIKSLLDEVRFIGKKASLGFGKVKNYKIEEIGEDKSFMLNEFTPSKPLSCYKWKINSKKIAFYRDLPPYYLKENIVPCYIPTRSLVEKEDKSRLNKNFKAVITDYISPTKFAKEYSGFSDVELFKSLKKGLKYVTDEEHRCIICGSIEKEGILGNPKDYLPNTFNDYAFLDKGDFICSNCLWSMKQERILGNTLITKDRVIYLQGGKMDIKNPKDQQKFRDEFFRNLDLLKPPFLISLKSTANAQHTVFKGKVAISNAMIPISFGTEEEILVDVGLLKEAINEMENILKNNSCIKKLHLTNQEQINDIAPKLSKKCMTKENIEIISNFYKKYDRSIRKVLNRILV